MLLDVLNHRFVRLPTSIGVVVIALVLSPVIIGLDIIGMLHAQRTYGESLLRSIDFSGLLIQGMLSLLLFAGALQVWPAMKNGASMLASLDGLRPCQWACGGEPTTNGL